MAGRLNSIGHSIVGHQDIIAQLLAAQGKGRLPTTFLLVGPVVVATKKTALALAQSLVCTGTAHAEAGACGECGPCLRIAKGHSEALLVIAPEKNQIKIDQTHHIAEFLHLRSISKARIIIIDSAEAMNPQAANSLLKALEEPPPDAYFFLIAPSPQHVLPTLRSRAQVVKFRPVSTTEMQQALVEKKTSAPEWALRASQGSFSRLAHLQNTDELESRDAAVQFLQLWTEGRESYRKPEWRELVRERSSAIAMTRHLNLFLRDAVIAHESGEKTDLSLKKDSVILNPDKSALIAKLAGLPRDRLHEFGAKALRLEGALLANRDVQLVFEEFWLT
jgi:DNA polymerase-3 subunit delta'